MAEVTRDDLNRMEDRLVKGLDHLTERMEKIGDSVQELSSQHVELRTRIDSSNPNNVPLYKNKTVQAHGGIGAVLLTVAGIISSTPEEPARSHITVEAAPASHVNDCDPDFEFCEE